MFFIDVSLLLNLRHRGDRKWSLFVIIGIFLSINYIYIQGGERIAFALWQRYEIFGKLDYNMSNIYSSLLAELTVAVAYTPLQEINGE